MTLGEMIDIVQIELDDVGVHYLNSGVSTAIQEGQRITSLMTLCYEKLSTSWAPTITAYQQFIPVPTDCIVPIYVRDKASGSRIYPAKLSNLELNDTSWWTTSGKGSAYEYYSIFNPSGVSATPTGGRYDLLLYPRVNTTSMRVEMIYAADPPAMSATTDIPKVPRGTERALIDYAIFLGLIRQPGKAEHATEVLKTFFSGVNEIGDIMKSRYPEGRDFEPEPVENILERVDVDLLNQKESRGGKRTNVDR